MNELSIRNQRITAKLRNYVLRYESQNKAANSLKGVSSATVSLILNGKTDHITPEMWRNIATQIGYKDENWDAVPTRDFQLISTFLKDAKENSLVLALTGHAGSGKSFAFRHFADFNRHVYMVTCSDYWNKKQFLVELMISMGLDSAGMSISEMMNEIVRNLKTTDHPMLILDEADKLIDSVLYFFITLYNQLEDECGIILSATNHFEKKLRRGLALNKKGYNEIWSRLGRKCINLKGVAASDIVAICEANGITAKAEIEKIINDSESDLRRVRRKVHAVKKATEKNWREE